MDEIRLAVKWSQGLSNTVYRAVVYFVNGQNLLDQIKEMEIKQEKKYRVHVASEDYFSIAGSYIGITVNAAKEHDYALVHGRSLSYYDLIASGLGEHELGIPIYVCGGCGLSGCWQLTVQVQVVKDYVIWSNFKNPRRELWRYDALGPFIFDRQQYEAEFARIFNEFAS